MKKTVSSIFLVLAATAMNAQIISVNAPSKAKEYSRVDCEVSLKGQWTNPYLQEEAALDMVITTPSGKTLTLPCFYENGASGEQSVWGARFTPQECGGYSYVFRYSEAGRLVSESAPASLKVSAGKSHGILHLNDNWTLKYDDGTLYRGIGENICWESRDNDDSKYFKALHEQHERFNYDVMLPKFAANGGNFVRVWMCSWNFPIDHQTRFNNSRYSETDQYMNPSAIERLDHTVQLAEQLDIKFMLCMGAGNVRTDHDFFINEQAKVRYKNRLRYIVARWGYSASIGMWEFFNEIDNIQFRDRRNPIPAEDIVAWHAEMAKYLKELDPFHHIVTTSISHRDLKGLNSVPDLDINQKHIYNATSVIPSTIDRYEKDFGKPYIIGEFGYEWDWSKNFDDFAEGMDTDFRRGLWFGVFKPTPVTPMSWWWEYFDQRNMIPYFKAVRQVSDQMLKESQGDFVPVEVSSEGGEAYALKCGKKIYVYVYNPTQNVISKLRITTDMKGAKVSEYDFNALKFSGKVKTPVKNGVLDIPTSVEKLGEALYMIE